MRIALTAIVVSMIGLTACGKDEPGGGVDPTPGGDEPVQPVEKPFKQNPSQSYQLLKPEELVTKNYYFLSLLKHLEQMDAEVKADPELSALAAKKFDAYSKAGDMTAKLQAAMFTQDEINSVKKYLAALWEENNCWDKLALEHLSPSGTYYSQKVDKASNLLAKAWEQDATGINRVISVYGIGSMPAHCDDDVKTAGVYEIDNALEDISASLSAYDAFYSLPLAVSEAILKANERDKEANNFEPMTEGCNKAAFEAVSKIDWSQYSYTIIMVPGAGPNDYVTALAEGGKARCDMGYALWKEGRAPFIMVSGGRIHPKKTKYCEAEEMKKYLITKGVPESAIIMEPHARHTPTNVRNMVRIIYRYGIPMDKPGLIACEAGTISGTFQSNAFMERCKGEYGFAPVSFGKALTSTSIIFYPLVDCLNIYYKDPLDP